MKCYNCGAELGRGNTCKNCLADVRIYKKIVMGSNAYYNDALKKAEVRDLSGAVESLKVSLRFYKLNTDARNLLGLVYYEMGEVVAALTEWVISKNYQPGGNLASRYLDDIQKNAAQLDSINQTIKKYNQALVYCRQNSNDLAILQLKKVLSMNPRFVSGHQLLALLYIQDGKYELAKKSLRNAAKIDTNNTMTLRYLKEVDAQLKEHSTPKKQKNEELISYQSGNETIIQPKYLKESSAMSTIINMVIGIAIGAAVTCFLIVPGVKRNAVNETKTEVLEANNTISSKNQTITSLQSQVDDLTNQLDAVKNNEEDSANKLATYDQLLTAYAAYTQGDIERAGDALTNVNEDYLSVESKQIYDTVNSQVNAEYLASTYMEGYKAYSARKYTEAIENLRKVVDMEETFEDGYALYYLAQSYRKSDDMDNARIYYQKFVDLYPNTERAANSQSYLEQMQ